MSAPTLDVEVQRGDNDPSGVWQIVDDAGNPVMAPRSAFMLMVIWRGGSIRKGTAGVPGAAYGLRAACARRAAEAGATEAQLDALSEWTPGSRESATDTRTADNARLARQAPNDPAPVDGVREEPRKTS